MMNLRQRFTDPSKPMWGFKSDGVLAYSRDEVMGDPCQILPDSLWESWGRFELRNHSKWKRWQTVWFMGIPMKVFDCGADGNWWGCAIDTATIIRLRKTDWEILKENYSG